MKVKLRAGSNLRTVLKSTVTIPQAFTELVKNCIQNDASFCKITLTENEAIIEDNGIGFSSKKDEFQLNSFDKYFVYGNSYDQMSGQGVRLGQMGIGGKVANDRLSHSTDTHWQIETKYVTGECFLVDYKPPITNFLDEYSPEIQKLETCSITSHSGTKIIIKSLNEEITNNGWDEALILSELKTFFSILIQDLQSQGVHFELYFQGDCINFNYKLPGVNINFIEKFKYTLINESGIHEEKTVVVDFRLSYVKNLKDLGNFHQKSIDIVSDVKVCPFTANLLPEKKVCQEIAKELGHNNFDFGLIRSYFHLIIGFISCKNISKDIDHTGNNAKDLSHHGLRSDHALTSQLYNFIGRSLINWIIAFDLADNSKSLNAIEALTFKIGELVMDLIDSSDLSDLIQDSGIHFTDVETRPEEALEKLGLASIDAALKTQKSLFSNVNKSKNMLKNIFSQDTWQDNVLRLVKSKKSIPFEIVAFEKEEINIMSKLDPFFKFKILINSENPKYKALYQETSPMLMSLYISELLIREIVFYACKEDVHKNLDDRISLFYQESYDKIKSLIGEKNETKR